MIDINEILELHELIAYNKDMDDDTSSTYYNEVVGYNIEWIELLEILELEGDD